MPQLNNACPHGLAASALLRCTKCTKAAAAARKAAAPKVPKPQRQAWRTAPTLAPRKVQPSAWRGIKRANPLATPAPKPGGYAPATAGLVDAQYLRALHAAHAAPTGTPVRKAITTTYAKRAVELHG